MERLRWRDGWTEIERLRSPPSSPQHPWVSPLLPPSTPWVSPVSPQHPMGVTYVSPSPHSPMGVTSAPPSPHSTPWVSPLSPPSPPQHPMGVTPAVHPTGRLWVPSIRWLWGQCWLYCCPLPTSWGSSEGREGGDGRMDGQRDGHGCRSVAVTVGGRRGEHWGCAAALRTPPTQPPYGLWSIRGLPTQP